MRREEVPGQGDHVLGRAAAAVQQHERAGGFGQGRAADQDWLIAVGVSGHRRLWRW